MQITNKLQSSISKSQTACYALDEVWNLSIIKIGIYLIFVFLFFCHFQFVWLRALIV